MVTYVQVDEFNGHQQNGAGDFCFPTEVSPGLPRLGVRRPPQRALLRTDLRDGTAGVTAAGAGLQGDSPARPADKPDGKGLWGGFPVALSHGGKQQTNTWVETRGESHVSQWLKQESSSDSVPGARKEGRFCSQRVGA